MALRHKPLVKDIMGVVHLRMPNSASKFPWCAQKLSVNLRSQRYQKKRLRLVKWAEDGEGVNCIRCLLIALTPGEYSDHFL
jgi:hypothetical protein